MSGFKVNFSVNNQLATPSIHAAPFAQRPAAGQPGRVFIDTDSPSTGIYRDTGTAWIVIGSPGIPEVDTLQTVTDRGNTTTQSVTIGSIDPPAYPLDVYGDTDIINVHATNGNDGVILFSKAGSHRWRAGNYHGGGNDHFSIYNMQENSDAILVSLSTNNVAIGGHTLAPVYKLDIAGSLANTGNAYFATSGGNVGIGTTSPASTLEINKSSGTNYIYVTNAAASSNNGVVLRRLGVDYMGMIGNFFTGELKIGGFNASTFFPTFYSNNAERMRITGGGNVLISTIIDTGHKFQVNGTTRLIGDVTIVTTTNSRNITFENSTLRAGVNISQPNNTLTFNNGNGFELNSQNVTFQTAGNTFFRGFQGGATFIYENSSSVRAWATVPDGNPIPYAWGRKLCLTGGTTITVPNASAVLDIQSTTMGFLPPRMTGAQAEAIATPAAGLMVYANNGNGVTITTTGWWGYDGASWVKLN